MNRINKLFQEKNKNVLSIFTTAGFPKLNSTIETLQSLQDAGVDMIELGMPFSDPLADGPVIQNSSLVAIKNGMNLNVLFEQLKDFRQKITVPVILMGYINPVLQYGFENFCNKCKEVGIDGIIIPDLPYQEYQNLYQKMFESNGLINVFLITPQTSDERIHLLDEATNGFIYLVSSASTTGNNKGIFGAKDYLQRLKAMNLKSKTVVGFNVNNSESFDFVCDYSNGAIIGSAFINAIEKSNNLHQDIDLFVKTIKK